ncbi:unnamed protein product [Parajaminaea phylloscopi]
MLALRIGWCIPVESFGTDHRLTILPRLSPRPHSPNRRQGLLRRTMAKKSKTKEISSPATLKARTAAPLKKPLPRGPHTLQLVFHTAVHSLLILLCTIVLPAHLVSRQSKSSSDSAGEQSHDPGLFGLFASVQYYFSLPANAENQAALKRATWGSLQALVVVEAWAALRFRKWWDLGAAIDAGDREAAQKATKEGWKAGAERLALTTLLSLPATIVLTYAALFLLGAPWPWVQPMETLMLSLSISFVVGLPLLHTLPTEMSHWTRILGFTQSSLPSAPSPHKPRERLIATQSLLPLLASLLGSAGLALDHGKAWLAWPLPPCLGLFLGATIAQWVGTLHYLSASSSPS